MCQKDKKEWTLALALIEHTASPNKVISNCARKKERKAKDFLAY